MEGATENVERLHYRLRVGGSKMSTRPCEAFTENSSSFIVTTITKAATPKGCRAEESLTGSAVEDTSVREFAAVEFLLNSDNSIVYHAMYDGTVAPEEDNVR